MYSVSGSAHTLYVVFIVVNIRNVNNNVNICMFGNCLIVKKE